MASKALSGLASIEEFCGAKGPLDTVEDLASEAFGTAHPSWTGTEVGANVRLDSKFVRITIAKTGKHNLACSKEYSSHHFTSKLEATN